MADTILQNDHIPVYNIKAVSRLVGLLPVTLRAWERRYGLPAPQRGGQGYRLYTEHDLRTLRWLKNQIDSGLNIGRAVDYLNELCNKGQDPAILPAAQNPAPTVNESPSLTAFSKELLAHLLEFNESGAAEVMRRAFVLYSVDQVLMEIVTPAMTEIGELWHDGKLHIAAEHYASHFCMQHLMSMLAASAPPSRPGLVVAACAPGETHQIGLLMLVVMLRWRGWNIKYLGPDLKLEGLEEALVPMNPTLLMFTANRPETAVHLTSLSRFIEHFPAPRPLVVVGGQAFKSMRLPESVPAIYIDSTPVETVNRIEQLLLQSVHPQPNLKVHHHVQE
jgi:MerR family transcriptional regulator, light-induced transcriptional regulator